MNRNNPKDLLSEIDLRLNGVFGELGRALGDAMAKLEEGGGEVMRTQSFQTPKGPMRAEAGIRVRVGGADFGTSSKRDVSPINAAQSAQDKPAPKDIAATVMTDDSQWTLTAELPGISVSDLGLSIEDGVLKIQARAGTRHYVGTFSVPAGVGESDIAVSLKNGVLDLQADLPKDATT